MSALRRSCSQSKNAACPSKHRSITAKLFVCKQCCFTTNSILQIKEHVIIHNSSEKSDGLLQCTECQFKTNYSKHLEQHFIHCHEGVEIKVIVKEQTLFGCEQCGFKTKYKQVLKQHLLTHKSVDEIDEVFQCPKCLYRAKYKKALKLHMRRLHKYSKDDLETELAQYQNSKKQQVLKCQQCNHVAKFQSSLRIHMLTHRSIDEVDEIFYCPRCAYRSKYKSSLNRHMRSHHHSSKGKPTDLIST